MPVTMLLMCNNTHEGKGAPWDEAYYNHWQIEGEGAQAHKKHEKLGNRQTEAEEGE